jgi:hypothetical protein
LIDLHLQRVMAEMLANQDSHSKEEHGIYRCIKKAREITMKMKRGQRLDSTIILDDTTLEDIWKVITTWWHNPNGVPPAICEDPNTHKLNGFACPAGKTIGQVNAYDITRYIQNHIRLTWEWILEWILEWICPYIKWCHQGSVYNTAAN